MKTNSDPPIFLQPFSADLFQLNYIDKERLVIHRNDESHFRDIVDLAHIDEMITSVRIPATNLNLAQDDAPLPLDAYCIGGSYIDKTRLLLLHEKGATIILRAAEQWSAKLNRLRIMAEEFFGCECQINVYLTPPGQKSTPPHWDTHDLIIMQITGRKTWRLYKGERTCPLADERFRIGIDHVSTEYEEINLQAGDTMYLPRGLIHEPVARNYSVHVSIGIHTLRWHDLLSVALRFLADREGSPLRAGLFRTANQVHDKLLLAEISQLIDPTLHSKALDILRERFAGIRSIDLQGAMLQSSENVKNDMTSDHVRNME